jgi:hypothetical protein
MSDWFVTNYHYLQEFGLISLQWLLSLSQYFGSNMTSIFWQAQKYDSMGFLEDELKICSLFIRIWMPQCYDQ